jgi:hypothetical protein
VRGYARKIDLTQSAIVDAVRKAGWLVFLIHEPCDALCWKQGYGWKTLEFKTPNRADGSYKPRADQEAQNLFCEMTDTPRVVNAEQALAVLEGK